MGNFGIYLRERRMQLGKTLRQFCLDNNLDPGNVSRIESGIAKPPQDEEKLEEYAVALGIKKETAEWHRFIDLAHAEVGTIPEDLMNDKTIVGLLPILFRKLRGSDVSDETLDKIVKKLKGEET